MGVCVHGCICVCVCVCVCVCYRGGDCPLLVTAWLTHFNGGRAGRREGEKREEREMEEGDP